MDLLNLLERELKSDPLIDLFETYDVEVVYEHDRTYEGMDDEYWAKIPSLGLQFVFNKNQKLQTVFVHLNEKDGFDSANTNDLKLTSFSTKSDALQFASNNDIPFSEGEAEFLGEHRDWIKFKHKAHSIHYEYRESLLSLITLQAENA